MMEATVWRMGPERAQLYVEEMAPHFVLVPVQELPEGVKPGDKVRVVITLLAARLPLEVEGDG